ncbi:U4/U6.U5 tri-snRNP-associated protein 2 [Dermatophagoides pteronyssinus]|uniref:ubiquitinyl hydrolase 1 n=1 Tax=Dermatophagoides pteronyssinus TaxID=6956 RepID=A0ABQ8JI62_DERPT|nr:U4/U6.U5 tri-snRNP-associated protein 2 [Dermatophagoides pteronyssinus]
MSKRKLINDSINNNNNGDNGDQISSKHSSTKKYDNRSRHCPYLDTINRGVLDFDFEKLCSISLSKINVYACLVCGKYFQGRGIGTHAYMHSVSCGHHVFLNLNTLKFYCLPDNYQIIDSSLDDIVYVLKPTFSSNDIKKLDLNNKLSIAYDGTAYLPGIVGLNNIKENDYCNVILQALSHVKTIRNYFLIESNYDHFVQQNAQNHSALLLQRFGELLRKLWNGKNFKAHVSPHEMLQAVVLSSKKRFQITQQGDPIDFLSWFLNALHSSLKGTNKNDSSIIFKTFRGSMKTYTRKVIPIDRTIEEKLKLMENEEYAEKCEDGNFLYLTLDLPSTPLFRDEMSENIIPQVPLSRLLAKFDGNSEKEYKTYKDSFLKRFVITKFPKHLILYIKRFTRNTFFLEKNPTIVNFPIKNADLSELFPNRNEQINDQQQNLKIVYDLVANIVHDGQPESGKGTYRIHILHKGTGKWFEIQDLHVTEILPQMITLSEAYIQIWEQQ